MDWIHCNKCFSQLTTTVSLFITTCGHMYCNICLGNVSVEKKSGNCIICRSPCSIIKLEPDMSPDVQEFFSDPEEIVKKLSQVLQFQRQHRKRLFFYLLQAAKKFHQTRNEVKRLSEIVQKQNIKLKQYESTIEYLKSEQGNSSRHVSPFSMKASPAYNNISPNHILCTPTFKNTAKSTPFSSNLVTPCRLTKQRLNRSSSNSQKSNNSYKISSTVLTPPTPESPGYNSPPDSGYRSASPFSLSPPGFIYCNGYSKKCAFKRN